MVRPAVSVRSDTVSRMVSKANEVPFDSLAAADLHVDAIYLSGTKGTLADEPLPRLMGVGNRSGFRISGSQKSPGGVKYAVLFTTGAEPDWPDFLDPQTGVFTYYGDNRKPGCELHETSNGGNRLLRSVFEAAHGGIGDRDQVPPFFLFEKALPGRSVRFRGLLAPGAETLTSDDELVAIWRSTGGLRFQNYRARFTVLDAGVIPRTWLAALRDGASATSAPDCPTGWREWVDGRSYRALLAPPTLIVRSKADQLPTTPTGMAILRTIHAHFDGRPNDFEACAVAIWQLIAPSTGRVDVTRPTRDGGRDAVGQYMLGPPSDPIAIDFALEAKCYAIDSPIGVKAMSRLISRLRYRHFGVFVTLSYFHSQVYTEVRTDEHPVAMISGGDVVSALRDKGYADAESVKAWLNTFTE